MNNPWRTTEQGWTDFVAPFAENARMQTINDMVRLSEGIRDRAELWTPSKRLEVARKMEQWAHELRMSVKIWRRRQNVSPRRPATLPPRKLALN